MLFHTDRTDENSNFREVIDKIGTQFVRFPGGTITEEYFDITNPNATHQVNVMDVQRGAAHIRSQDVLTLSEYLSYKTELDGDPVIVMPTYRFFDLDNRTVLASAEGDIREFINKLLTDQFGDVTGVTIELGNEFYQGHFDWTEAEFGALQAQIAAWIDDEARSLGVRDDLTILAQTGQSEDSNSILAEFFAESAHTIDGVLTHFYGANSSGNPLGIGGGVGARLKIINSIWSQVLGDDYELAVTEWNVGDDGIDNTIINGVMRSAPLLRMYAEMLEGGVDMAMIWSAQTAGPAGLSRKEGTGTDLSPTGYLFSMLAESTEGLRLVDQGRQFKLRDADGETLGYTYTFEGEDRSVTYLASGVGQPFQLSASMLAFYEPGAYVYARVLDVAPGQNLTDFWSDASISYLTNFRLAGTGKLFDFEVQPYQLIELHVVTEGGITLAGDNQNDIADNLIGTAMDDTLVGNGGADRLSGNGGVDQLDGGAGRDVLLGGAQNDVLDGGDGADFIYGGRDNDTLIGGAGNDRMRGNRDDDDLSGGDGVDVMFGGTGNDTLSGGAHRDYLLGESGNDRLDGGTGDDKLYGGGGKDAFVFGASNYGYDRVMDFQPGQDRIDLTAFELADFLEVKAKATDTSFGLKIDFDNGNVLLVKGITKAEMDADDFVL